MEGFVFVSLTVFLWKMRGSENEDHFLNVSGLCLTKPALSAGSGVEPLWHVMFGHEEC